MWLRKKQEFLFIFFPPFFFFNLVKGYRSVKPEKMSKLKWKKQKKKIIHAKKSFLLSAAFFSSISIYIYFFHNFFYLLNIDETNQLNGNNAIKQIWNKLTPFNRWCCNNRTNSLANFFAEDFFSVMAGCDDFFEKLRQVLESTLNTWLFCPLSGRAVSDQVSDKNYQKKLV